MSSDSIRALKPLAAAAVKGSIGASARCTLNAKSAGHVRVAFHNWLSVCLLRAMEITAALLLPIASIPQATTEASQQFLFTDVLSEAVSMPAEPSAWTLLNPIVLPEDSDAKLVEPPDTPEEQQMSDHVVFVPPQPPVLEPKLPLQLQLPSKELTSGVKKLPLENAALEFLRDNAAVSIDEAQELPDASKPVNGMKPRINKDAATGEQQVGQLVAFTARVSKAHGG